MRPIIPIIFVVLAWSGVQGQDRIEADTLLERRLEEYAKYPGGVDNLYAYVRENLKYPASALKDSITGDVHVEFIVNAKGQIDPESVKIVGEGLSKDCDQEAIRLIRSSPGWIPARTREKDTEQHITFPVSFQLP